ncbi:hypothetical protein ACUDUE_001169 [Pseudomonas aeruginosa]
MEAKFLPPAATIIAAIIAWLASRNVQKQSRISEKLNREHQEQISELNHVFKITAMQSQERFSLRAKALIEASRLAGETCYYLERFLTSYTTYQPMPRSALIEKAEESFELLIKFRWENNLFLWSNDAASRAFGEIMDAINSIKNKEPSDGSFSEGQVLDFMGIVQPAMKTIRDEYKKELMISEPER